MVGQFDVFWVDLRTLKGAQIQAPFKECINRICL